MRGRLREHRSTILVAALSATLGTLLLDVVGALGTVVDSSTVGGNGVVHVALLVVAATFLAISVYVAAVVTANTVATMIAGRRRLIALYRLIGSSASAQRRAVASEGLVAGVAGAVIGLAVGIGISAAIVGIAVATGLMPTLAYDFVRPELAPPVVVVILTTWLASWIGARRVLDVTPLEATAGAVEPPQASGRRRRISAAIVLMVLGFALLGLGVVAGIAVGPAGLLVALPGGILSFSGLIAAAPFVMPPVLRLVGRAWGTGPAARLAAANAVRHPERSARATIGLVIGVTLVTTFAVAAQSYQSILDGMQVQDPQSAAAAQQIVDVTMAVFLVLIGFSAVIAAVGMVNSLSLSVLQRQRELGLLRVLGFTRREVRWMILAEAAQMAVAAIAMGLVLGTLYGWAGAQSLLGKVTGAGGIIAPAVPWQLLVGAVVVAGLLTLIASIAPARRALRASPIAALSIE